MTLSLERPKQKALIFQKRNATWEEYVEARDNPENNWRKISFSQGWLRVDMGKEGPNHAAFSDLINALIFAWAFANPDVALQSFGRCHIEHPRTEACAPDIVLYKGKNIPKWKAGEPRRISLNRNRLPDLVGEVGDTTLSIDLDEQKQLYATMGISEYWVIDVIGKRVFAFTLSERGQYEPIETSQVLEGLQIDLIEQTLKQLEEKTNTAAANWFAQQLREQPEQPKEDTAEQPENSAAEVEAGK